jgi:hypothetical protein
MPFHLVFCPCAIRLGGICVTNLHSSGKNRRELNRLKVRQLSPRNEFNHKMLHFKHIYVSRITRNSLGRYPGRKGSERGAGNPKGRVPGDIVTAHSAKSF